MEETLRRPGKEEQIVYTTSDERVTGLYLHIPFCVKKCRYCDFLSFPVTADVRERYVAQLEKEIREAGKMGLPCLFSGAKREKKGDGQDTRAGESDRDGQGTRSVREERDNRGSRDEVPGQGPVWSIFLGGGTPSLLEPSQVERLLAACRESFPVARDAEITMECNPGTVTEQSLLSLRGMGINRLSMGVQAADNVMLRRLGRIHTWEEACHSFAAARRAGFENLNVDLICSLPDQTLAGWMDTLQKTVALGPEHISAYSLIIEEGTPFYELYGAEEERRQRGEKTEHLPDEETDRDMYEKTAEFLAMAGYERYEISNYARPGRESIHNCGYWERRPYLGFGLGAASQAAHLRWRNTRDLEFYLRGGWRRKEEVEHLSLSEEMGEAVFLGLRMMRGVSEEVFARRYGRSYDAVFGPVSEQLEKEGLLRRKNGFVRLTLRGIDLSNYVFSRFWDTVA